MLYYCSLIHENLPLHSLYAEPIAYPGSFHGAVNSSTVATFRWQLIPFILRNGIITSHRVTYFPLNDAGHIKSTYFFGEAKQEGVVQELRYWTYYNFSISAGTIAGFGPNSGYITLRTEQHSKLFSWTICLSQGASTWLYSINYLCSSYKIAWKLYRHQLQLVIIS